MLCNGENAGLDVHQIIGCFNDFSDVVVFVVVVVVLYPVLSMQVRGSTGDQSFKDKDAGLCLYLSPQALSWSQARAACHAGDSVLVSLDSVLNVEGRLFQQYLKDKGWCAVTVCTEC